MSEQIESEQTEPVELRFEPTAAEVNQAVKAYEKMRWRQGTWKFPTVSAIVIGLPNGFYSGVTTGPEYDRVATGY